MADTRLPFQVAQATVRADERDEVELPADFVVLRLALQPRGLCVQLTRPEMMLGRHSAADIRLTLPDISRRHCRFVFHDGHWQVFDLHSLNGVFVNGARVQEATLCKDDVLQIGGLAFHVELAPPAQHDVDANILPGPTTHSGEQRKAS